MISHLATPGGVRSVLVIFHCWLRFIRGWNKKQPIVLPLIWWRTTNHEPATHSVDDDDDQSKEEYTSYFLVGVETLVPAMFEKIDDWSWSVINHRHHHQSSSSESSSSSRGSRERRGEGRKLTLMDGYDEEMRFLYCRFVFNCTVPTQIMFNSFSF